uniref:Sema domain-containing protein n=1 Tax=Eptatretus burgeri TaxID=7764 RepID=A0A8C4QWS8_EPTBU
MYAAFSAQAVKKRNVSNHEDELCLALGLYVNNFLIFTVVSTSFLFYFFQHHFSFDYCVHFSLNDCCVCHLSGNIHLQNFLSLFTSLHLFLSIFFLPVIPNPFLQCPSSRFGGFHSTKDYPDTTLSFVRSHPIMAQSVHPMGGRPLLVRTREPSHVTRLAVDRVEARDGHYDVLFMGTDKGSLLKVVLVPKVRWSDLEGVTLEEVQLFKVQNSSYFNIHRH